LAGQSGGAVKILKTTRTELLVTLLLIAIPLMGQEICKEEAVEESDIKATHVEEVKYPPLPRQARIQGVVVIRAKLDDEGNVVSSSAISGHPLFVKDCLSNVLKWKFEPNASKQVVIVYDFKLEGACEWSSPCLSTFSFRKPNFATITGPAPMVNP
jgi:TonB family protein